MNFGMFIRFTNIRYEIGKFQVRDGNLFGYKCEKCGKLVHTFPISQMQRFRPELLQYPEALPDGQRVMKLLTDHDNTHALLSHKQPQTLEGKR